MEHLRIKNQRSLLRNTMMRSADFHITLLTLACTALLGARSVASMAADGTEAPDVSTVTFNKHVAPIIFARCAACHRPGEAAPFSLLNYRDVKRRARQIVEVTTTRFMPPWQPEPGYGRFVGERRLSNKQIALIQRWLQQGTLEGSAGELPPTPKFSPGWQLGKPDHVVRMTQPYQLGAAGTDVYRNFLIPSGVAETRYVRAVEFRPGNSKIVHHANLRVDPTSESRRLDRQDPEPGFEGMWGEDAATTGRLVGWHPGRFPVLGPADMAWTLQRGSDLVLLLHMLPTGKPELVEFTIGFHFSKQPPTRRSFVVRLASKTIDISPGVTDYAVEDHYQLPVDVEVFGVRPHAHLLAKDIQGYATLPDGTRHWLIRIKDWDFNWQDEYRYQEPVRLPQGTRLTMRYIYDNSSANPHQAHVPPRRVKWGPKTADEMGVLFVELAPRQASDYSALVADFENHELQLNVASARKWLEESPHDPAQHLSLGVALMGLGQTEEATENFRQAIKWKPDDSVAAYNLGLALASQGRHDDAIRQFQEALLHDPKSSRSHYGMGLTMAAKGDATGAVEQYRKALQIRPDYAEAHNNLAAALASQKKQHEAVKHVRIALEIKPDYAEAHNNLGLALQAERKLEEAVRQFRQALEIRPNYVAAHRNLGRALAMQGQLDEAIDHFNEALRLGPNVAETHHALGKALALTSRFEQAVRHFRQAARLKTSWVPPINDAAWLLATHPDEKLRDSPEAVRLAKRAAQLTQSRHPGILSTLAAAYAANGQYNRAVATAEKALSIAKASGADNLAERIRYYLAHYRQRKPYRQAPTTAKNRKVTKGE